MTYRAVLIGGSEHGKELNIKTPTFTLLFPGDVDCRNDQLYRQKRTVGGALVYAIDGMSDADIYDAISNLPTGLFLK